MSKRRGPKRVKPKGAEVTRHGWRPEDNVLVPIDPEINIAAWCPDRFGMMPPEQVHMTLKPAAESGFVGGVTVRFKGPDSIGFLIEELAKYRREVWPNAELVIGEEPDRV